MPETRTATVLGPAGGELLDAAGDRYRMLATRETTGGRYGLWEAVVPPGGGPVPHRHSREDEGFYVVEGEVTIHVDGRAVAATAGSFVNLPVGVPHSFRNDTDRPAKLLVLVAPGGMEGLFKLTGRPAPAPAAPIPPMDDDEKRRNAEAVGGFGIEILPPPAGGPSANGE